MLISCPWCGFSRTVAEQQIPAGVSRVTCPKCGQVFPLPSQEDAAPVRSTTEGQDEQPIRETRTAAEALPKAGFWIRLVAAVVDMIIVFSLQFVLGAVLAFAGIVSLGFSEGSVGTLTVLVQIFSYALSFAYSIVFTGYCGQTPGKMALRIKVIRRNGSQIGFGRAAFREIPAKFIAAIIFGIGYLMVAFDEQKQGLHDRMADTYVIKL
ncbi:RDD family protein [Pelobacter seleniigenes]|uniref:RDD family protein n=1 Tax=Pelobacter seleniigenes TaxID=407188 RepID=UPI00068F17D2|nr:RDD family protein [Pelobacter seleniigenes]